jgi:protocatechuate 3,4-dioxygenase beta subunit
VVPNDSWVLTPDGISGPYVYPPSQTLRQVKTENQPSKPLWLDIGIIDMATCEPLNDALVDIWHCNATGSYSSFAGLSPNIPFPQLLQKLNISN